MNNTVKISVVQEIPNAYHTFEELYTILLEQQPAVGTPEREYVYDITEAFTVDDPKEEQKLVFEAYEKYITANSLRDRS